MASIWRRAMRPVLTPPSTALVPFTLWLCADMIAGSGSEKVKYEEDCVNQDSGGIGVVCDGLL